MIKTYRINDFIIETENGFDVNWNFVMTIPEFKVLETIEQSPKWHKEGNVLIHSKLVCEEMVNYINSTGEFYGITAKVLIMAALCHDLGKATKTFLGEDNVWHAYGHEIDSERITRKLLWDEDYTLREMIWCLVRYHMIIKSLYERKDGLYQALIDLAFELKNRYCTLNMLFTLMICDNNGSIPEDIKMNDIDNEKICGLIELSMSMNILNECNYIDTRLMCHHRHKREKKNMGLIHVIFMVGLPGAGKNTYIDEYYGDKDKYIVLSRDDIRVELGLCTKDEKIVGTPEQEMAVTNLFNKKMEDAINQGKYIVINNINLKKKHRDSIKKQINNLCKNKFDVWYLVKWIETSMENHFNRRKGQISEEVFNNMLMYIDFPTFEDFHLISHNRN